MSKESAIKVILSVANGIPPKHAKCCLWAYDDTNQLHQVEAHETECLQDDLHVIICTTKEQVQESEMLTDKELVYKSF